MPGSDTLWYCHECNAEMRPIVMSPEPLCASCNSSFIEQLPASDTAEADDPRAFNAMNRLFGSLGTPHEHEREHEYDHNHGIGVALDPVGQILGAVLGMRNLGPDGGTPRGNSRSGTPDPGSNRPTIQIRRDSDNNGRTRSGGMQFTFRSGSGNGSGSGTGSGFGMFGGFGRREERQPEPLGIDEFLATMLGAQGGQGEGGNQGQGRRPPPMLQNMLMGLLGAGIGNPGVGTGAAGDGRWGDYVLNQEALDQIITQLMDANHAAPVPAPGDMISTWPRTILTPGNPLENQDCAVCKESFTYTPPDPSEPHSSSSQRSGDEAQPQEALTLPCKHSFHVECIEPWVKVKGTCPVCRFELVPQSQRGQENDNNPGGSGSRNGGDRGATGSGSGQQRNWDADRRGSPMPPGAYSLD